MVEVALGVYFSPDDGCYIVQGADGTAINPWGADLEDAEFNAREAAALHQRPH